MRKAARIFTGPGMLLAGIVHLVNPKIYRPMMPDYLPAHHELIIASGVVEIAVGAGSLAPETRRPAGILGIATLIAFLPVHLFMLQKHEERFAKIPRWALIVRLPIHALMIWAVYDTTLRDDAADA